MITSIFVHNSTWTINCKLWITDSMVELCLAAVAVGAVNSLLSPKTVWDRLEKSDFCGNSQS